MAVSYFLGGLKEFYRALKVMEDNSNWGLSVIQMDIINEEKLKAVECNKFIYPMAVSYTHLDVYKRQPMYP